MGSWNWWERVKEEIHEIRLKDQNIDSKKQKSESRNSDTSRVKNNSTNDKLLAHAQGWILGAFIGDAAGAVLEFYSKTITKKDVDHALTFPGGGCWNVEPGQITDDSEMAMCLMNAIIEDDGVDQETIAKEYLKWYQSIPFDIGQTTQAAMIQIQEMDEQNLKIEECLNRIKNCNEGSLSNGWLMRATPLAVYCHNMEDYQIYKYTKRDVNLTHSNELAVLVVTCYNIAIAHLLNNFSDSEGAISRVESFISNKDDKDLSKHWKVIINAKSEEDLPSPVKNIGYIMIAFSYAFFYLKHNYTYEKAIKAMLIKGGDTDTNAAIVGGLIGAWVGINEINSKWRDEVLNCKNNRPSQFIPQSKEYLFSLISKLFSGASNN